MVAIPNIFNFFKSTTALKAQSVDKKPMAFIAAGTSGTEIYSGYFSEEYLSKFYAERGIKIFDEMRRSDGQVKMLLQSVKNPIKSATWEIEPAGEEQEDYDVADFIRFILFRDIYNLKTGKKKSFNDFVSEALTMIEFGFSAFEIVHKSVKAHPIYGDYIGLSDIGFRHQRSIIEWILSDDGSLKAVRQIVNGDLGTDVYISGQHILTFAMDKEGDNYEGISMLRPCYGAWFRKNVYRKLQAIGIERCAKGIPIGTIPADLIGSPDLDQQISLFQELIDALAAHEKNGIVLGAGFDIKELKISHDSEKVQKVIDSENLEMSKAFLANFMELGLSGNSGSFALGADQSTIFLSGIQYIADLICEKVNCQVIEPLVRAKYGEMEKYPKLKVTGINDKAGKEAANSISSLLDRGAIQKSTRLQRHLHKLYKLPDLDEAIAEKDDIAFLMPPAPENPALSDKKKPLGACVHEKIGTFTLSEVDRKQFPVSGKIEDYAADLLDFMQKSLKQRSAAMAQDMASAIKKGGPNVRENVLKIKMPKNKAYITALTEWAGDVVEKTFLEAIAEVGLKEKDVKFSDLKKAPKKLRNKLTNLILLTADYQDIDIEKAAYFAFASNYETLTEAALINEIINQIERYFAKNILETASVNMASQVVNSTRKETFLSDDVAGDIESFVFMNPDPVSPICKALNGKVFSKDEFETSDLTPPLHHNCKSYIRAQTKGEKNNLPITGLKIDAQGDDLEKIMRSKTL
jgi:SPP1 gp7 family putative phage head morphogenesis protein